MRPSKSAGDQDYFRLIAFFTLPERRPIVMFLHPGLGQVLSQTCLFHVSRDRPDTENALLRALEVGLRESLPTDWVLRREGADRGRQFDAQLTLQPPDGPTATLLVEAKIRFGPRDVGRLREQRDEAMRTEPQAALVLVAPYLSPRTQQLLANEGINYVDSTGNARVSLGRPAVFIQTEGADADPWPAEAKLRSLKGPAAGRVVRAVLDFKPPYGVSELAGRSGSPLATVYRVIDLLDREGLLERQPRGPVTRVDWEGVLQRWTSEYSLSGSNRVASYLEPRGLDRLLERLRSTDLDYAVTGSLAAARIAPVAASRLGMVFVDGDTDEAAERLDLRGTDEGANVFLIAPFDRVALERGPEEDGIRYAAASQVAADLAKSPGRGPSEGEALIRWMAAHEDAWRS
jgi:hypothetical protein